MKTHLSPNYAIGSEDPQERTKAVELIYDQCYPKLKRYILQNDGTEEEAKDMFQEALVVTYKNVKAGLFKGHSSIETYVFSICKNLWLQHLRKTSRQKQHLANLETDESEKIENVDVKLLDSVLKELKEDCRHLLIAFYYHQKTIKELQDQFEMKSEQVVKNKKGRCLKYLMGIIKKKKLGREAFYE